MKRALPPVGFAPACLVAAAVVATLWTTPSRADSRPNTPRTAASASNAAPAEIVIPKSVFVIPSSPREGTDPFFPKSTRRVEPLPKDTRPAASAELHLKGFSGPPQHRLAIINNYTMAAGEESDLNLGSARVHVRCVEIKDDSVVVEVGGERRELRLRQGL